MYIDGYYFAIEDDTSYADYGSTYQLSDVATKVKTETIGFIQEKQTVLIIPKNVPNSK